MLHSAKRHQALTRALAERAVREARRGNVGRAVVRHQAAVATLAPTAVSAMLAEQDVSTRGAAPEGRLNALAFTADPAVVDKMAADVDQDWRMDRLVAGLVSDAARAAGSVSVASRPRIHGFVRVVSTPCCSRCAILAGREYRWDAGFDRHPGCDCSELPIEHPGSEFMEDPRALVEGGHVRGMSKADMKAYDEGGDLNQLVNVKRVGLRRVNFGPGRTATTTSTGRLTPDTIYRVADGDRDLAIRLLKTHAYIV